MLVVSFSEIAYVSIVPEYSKKGSAMRALLSSKKIVELEINVRILESFEVHGLTATELPSDEQESEERNKIEP